MAQISIDPDQYVPGQSVHGYPGKRKGASAIEGKPMNDANDGHGKLLRMFLNAFAPR